MVAEADIVIENYRPDVMPRLGLGYDTLKAVNPGLIMLSISGFGQGGPESHRPAYAPIIHAEAGLMQRQANRGGIATTDLPLSVADTNASLHGLVGLLAAVIMRQRTGKGQHIDIAMIDATFATDDQVQYALEDAEDTAALPNDVWATGAGPILLSADFRFLWIQPLRWLKSNIIQTILVLPVEPWPPACWAFWALAPTLPLSHAQGCHLRSQQQQRLQQQGLC